MPINTLKISLLAMLLLGVFSLPTITATQLVGVLGESTLSAALEVRAVTDSATFVRQVGSEVTVSFTKSGTHPVIRIVNPANTPKIAKLALAPARDSSLLTQTVDLTVGNEAIYRLYDHSTQPFNGIYQLTLKPFQSVTLNLNVASDNPAVSYGTFTMNIGEI